MKNFLHWLQFNFWYLHKPRWDSGVTPPELWDYIRAHPPGRALDLGCGTGTNVISLAQNGWQVLGVDFVPRAIFSAKRKAKLAALRSPQAEFRVGDVTRLENVSPPFNLILDIGCFHGVTDKPAYLRQLNRLLAPRGNWLVYGFFKQDARADSPGLTEADLRAAKSAGLELLRRADGFDKIGRPSVWLTYRLAVTLNPATTPSPLSPR